MASSLALDAHAAAALARPGAGRGGAGWSSTTRKWGVADRRGPAVRGSLGGVAGGPAPEAAPLVNAAPTLHVSDALGERQAGGPEGPRSAAGPTRLALAGRRQRRIVAP